MFQSILIKKNSKKECHTLSGQIDFKAFVDFVIAQEHNGEPEAQRRYFQLLDLEGCHYLDEKIIRHHFNCLSERLVSFGQEPVPMEELLVCLRIKLCLERLFG